MSEEYKDIGFFASAQTSAPATLDGAWTAFPFFASPSCTKPQPDLIR